MWLRGREILVYIHIIRAERLLKTIARDFFVVEIRAVLNEASE